jgi:putative holliday junction resolvase
VNGPPPDAPAAPPPRGGNAGGPAEPVPRRLLGAAVLGRGLGRLFEMAVAAAAQCFLAFDFGTRRVGVAVGNSLLKSAQPLRTVASDGDARFVAIAALISEWQPDALVVGVPFHPDGAAHDNTHHARRFARQLHGRFRLPVHEVDERYSTTEALSEGAADADAAAAAIILNQFFRESLGPVHAAN